MIDEYYTFKIFGYNTDGLSNGSHKKVVAVCDECGLYRDVCYRDHKELCISCSNIRNGKNKDICLKKSISHMGLKTSDATKEKIRQSNKGHIVTIETRNKISDTLIGAYVGENNPNWRGGYEYDRSHLLHKSQCIQMNDWFDGCNAHHITKSIIAFIPDELHKHIKHSLKTGSNMGEMNALAIQFINGGM